MSSNVDKLKENEGIKHIGWDDLDKRKYYFFGPLSMVAVRLIIFPPMLIKTRLQVQKQTTLYNGTYDAFKKIFKHEGIRGYYKGFAAYNLTVISGQIYITTYELVRANLPMLTPGGKSLVAGLCASLAGLTITVPVDIVTQKQMIAGQQVGKKNSYVFHSAPSVASKIYKKTGLRGFYKGYLASILTYTPSSGIWWAAYYDFGQLYGKYRPEGVPDIVIQAMSGMSASSVAALVSNPVDTIRTRQQVSGGTIISVTKQLIHEEGIRCLTKGLTARLTASVPSGSCLIVSYELVKRLCVKSELR